MFVLKFCHKLNQKLISVLNFCREWDGSENDLKFIYLDKTRIERSEAGIIADISKFEKKMKHSTLYCDKKKYVVISIYVKFAVIGFSLLYSVGVGTHTHILHNIYMNNIKMKRRKIPLWKYDFPSFWYYSLWWW